MLFALLILKPKFLVILMAELLINSGTFCKTRRLTGSVILKATLSAEYGHSRQDRTVTKSLNRRRVYNNYIWVIKMGDRLGFASVLVRNSLVYWNLLSLSLLANLQICKVAEGTEYFKDKFLCVCCVLSDVNSVLSWLEISVINTKLSKWTLWN